MTNTFLSTTRHVLVRKAKGKYHAAVEAVSGYRTACGEFFPEEATIVVESDELPFIIDSEPGSICRRCDRVGNAIVPDSN